MFYGLPAYILCNILFLLVVTVRSVYGICKTIIQYIYTRIKQSYNVVYETSTLNEVVLIIIRNIVIMLYAYQ